MVRSEITQNGKWAGANNLLIEDLSVMVLVYESEILTKKIMMISHHLGLRLIFHHLLLHPLQVNISLCMSLF